MRPAIEAGATVRYIGTTARAPINEAVRWWNGESVTRIRSRSGLPGDPIKAIAVPGFTSTEAHITPFARDVAQVVPDGSTIDVYSPTTVLNLAVLDRNRSGPMGRLARTLDPGGFADFRLMEERHLDDVVEKITDKDGAYDVFLGHSLGGVLGLGAVDRMDDTSRLRGGVITLGSPHGMHEVGNPDIDIRAQLPEGYLHTIVALRDVVVSQANAQHPNETHTDKVSGGHLGLIDSRERTGVPQVLELIANRFTPVDPQETAA